MKIVFFGSGDFAVPILDALIYGGEDILAVITRPDKPSGRNLKVTATPVKARALKSNLALFQPDELLGAKVYDCLKGLNADLFVVASYGKIIPRRIIELPKIFSVNAHASLLPKYRGAAPINRAIMQGEVETGVSVIKMNEFMDKGDIILEKCLPIYEEDDASALGEKLANLAKDAIAETLNLIKNKKYTLTKQDDKNASYARKLRKEDGLIDWNRSACDIFNQVRGLVPWPGAYTYYKGEILKIWKAVYLDSKNDKLGGMLKPGEISDVAPQGISVCCGNGILLVSQAQLAAGKRMTAHALALGHKIKSGDVLG